MSATGQSYYLPAAVQDQLIALAAADPNEEVCGLIVRSGATFTVLAIANVAADRTYRYELNPKELIGAFKRLRATGADLHGIYHSHPFSPAQPSATDCREANYPDTPYVIVSPHGTPAIRAFKLRTDGYDELTLFADISGLTQLKP